jgi:putative transposase
MVGELRKLGIEGAKSTVEKYRVPLRKPPTPTWKTFLKNHMQDLVSLHFFMSETEEAKVLPLLLHHCPGTVLPNHIYVVSEEAAKKLREAGVQFTELSRESNIPSLAGVGSGERI